MITRPAPDVETAMLLGMAGTALPFARSPEAEAERWLRILRLHGEAGAALQALGVSEAPLEGSRTEERGAPDTGTDVPRDMVGAVSEQAVKVASQRGSHTVGAGDVLVAAMWVYGADFDHVLRVHGTDREEVLQRLGIDMPEGAAA